MPLSGIDLSTIDASVRPQDDLYQHVNGGWLNSTVIPDDRPLEGTFTALRDASELAVKEIIERGRRARRRGYRHRAEDRGPVQQLHGRGRGGGQGPGPAPGAAGGGVCHDVGGRTRGAGRTAVPRRRLGGLFYIYPAPDAGNPDRVLLYTGQGGLGLPDESYYREEKFAPMVQAYREHVQTMFGLADVADPEGAAGRVVALETALASHHWDNVDPAESAKDVQPEVRRTRPRSCSRCWPTGSTPPASTPEKRAELVMSTPDFFAGAASLLDTEPLATWQEWLAMRVVSAAAPYLSSAFVDANFAFYGTTLSGTPRNKDRWKRGVAVVEAALGEAVGQIYVAGTSRKATRRACRPLSPT